MLVVLASLIYILIMISQAEKKTANSLYRHRNFMVVTQFYIFAFLVTMMTNVNLIEKQPVHIILYHSLPTIYCVVLLFLYSVSPRGTEFSISTEGELEVANKS